MYDIIFISYHEPNAEKNFSALKDRFHLAKRIDGITGIHQAHIEAAKKSFTKMFWVVDGDAEILDTFNFNYKVAEDDFDTVHVWRSRNPINDLEYGYGGVKLLPKKLTMNMDITKPDMSTSISDKFKALTEISNITSFNTDAFSTWRSAFRECVKLSSRIIDRQDDVETTSRLIRWCTVGDEKPWGVYAIAGAIAGKTYGEKNASNLEALRKINDFDYLKVLFNQQQGQ
jgi:hypothetical protein